MLGSTNWEAEANPFLIHAREIPVISRRQRPDRMQMIGQQHHGTEIERPSPFGFPKDDPKQSHGGEFSKHRRIQFRFHSEEARAVGNENASIVGHPDMAPRSHRSAQRTLSWLDIMSSEAQAG